MYKSLISYIMFTVVGGNSAVPSWDPTATTGPVARLNNFVFQTVIYVLDLRNLVTYKEHSKVLKARFVVFPRATYSFIFVNNIKLVHRRQY